MRPALARPKLLEKLRDPDARLIVVRAPAGFGKTTLLQQWYDELQQSGIASGWLTLDKSDNDPTRLVAALTQAIHRSLGAKAGSKASADSRDNLAFAGLIASVSSPLILLLDDVDMIEAEGARSVLRMLVRMAAAPVRIVLAGRDLPSLGQAGLRVTGVVADIGVEDLRFDRFEASAFLSQRLKNPLTSSQLESIHEGTGGWVAALQLASLAIDGSAAVRPGLPRATILDRSIAEYLQDDVLERQPAEIQDFLHGICILPTLTGELCDALTGRDDGEANLVQLDSDGLLLKRLESSDGRVWYRFHAMFADFLSDMSGMLPASSRARLHERAADWFEDHGMIAEAARHAFQAGRPERAYDLLDSIAMEHIWQGRLKTVLDWSRNMTTAQAQAHWQLFAASLWAEGFAGDPQRAKERWDAVLQQIKVTAPTDEFMADTLYCLPILLAAARQDYHFLIRIPPRALENLARTDSYEFAALANTLGYTSLALGKPEEARQILARAKAACLINERSYNLAFSHLFDGLRQLTILDLHGAIDSLREGYARVNREHTELSQSAAVVGCVLADALLENGETDAAMMLVDRHLPMIEDGLSDCIILYYLVGFRIAVAAEDTVRARELVEELDACGTKKGSSLLLRAALAFRSVVTLLEGDRQDALSLAKQLAAQEALLDQRILPPVEALVRDVFVLRVQATVEPTVALAERIAGLADAADLHHSHRRALQLRLLHAQVLEQLGDTALADDIRNGVRATTGARPFAQSFDKESQHIIEVVARKCEKNSGAPEPAPNIPPRHDTDETARFSEAELAALTQRERDILGVVSRGLTNREIADCFSLSETTVKWHLRNIFGKLGVGNRTEAAYYSNLL